MFLAQKLAEDHLLAIKAIMSADDHLLEKQAEQIKICLRTAGHVLGMVQSDARLVRS